MRDQFSFIHARTDSSEAFTKDFEYTTLTSAQQNEFFVLCARYRATFSLDSSELDKCTTMEVSFPVQPGTVPVPLPPYKTHPRAQEVIHKWVDQLETDSSIEKR